MGVLYILDEPSIGLHQRDNDRLIATLVRLRALGNTLLVVEHDEETIRSADWVIDIGPAAGSTAGVSSTPDLSRGSSRTPLDHRGVPARRQGRAGAERRRNGKRDTIVVRGARRTTSSR